MRDGRITYKQAVENLSVGDTVYMVCGSEVVEKKVLAIRWDKLKCEDCDLYYSDHREKWFLTKLFARIAAKGETK